MKNLNILTPVVFCFLSTGANAANGFFTGNSNRLLADTCVQPCGLLPIEMPNDCYDLPFGISLLSLPDEYRYYTPVSAYFFSYTNGTALIEGDFVSVNNANANLHVQLALIDGKNWEQWDDMPFPTNYVADCSASGDHYLEWKYFIIDESSSFISGSGELEGTYYQLHHAPANQYFAHQVGDGANYVGEGQGSGGWFTCTGVFVMNNAEISTEEIAGTAYFNHDCSLTNCPADLDINGEVNVADLLSFSAAIGCVDACGCNDLDGNAVVNVVDLLVFTSQFGTHCN